MPYLTKSKKSNEILQPIEQAIEILAAVGIPVETKTEGGLEKMAMVLLAVAGVVNNWSKASGINEKRFLKTREIIDFINTNFEENISSGSYDDLRRKDLRLLVLDGLIINSAENPIAATNDPTRGYALENGFAELIRTFGATEWNDTLTKFLSNKVTLKEILARKREIEKVHVLLPNGEKLNFSAGQHNVLQKQIIEEFLPGFGRNCKILYVGDTADKLLHIDKEELQKLNFFELSREKLPDIIAYSSTSNWLFLIEAVYSSGSINKVRMLELKRLTENCKAEIIYVTAFLAKTDFRKWVIDIAWETEVWIAENPDHLIHFNGENFLGAYKT